MLRASLVFASLLLLPGPAAAQTIDGTLPPPLPLFPPDNWWNLDITNAPVDSNSTNFINFIGATRALHPDFGPTDGTTNGIYGIPYVVVSGAQTKVPVTFVEFPDESDCSGTPPDYTDPPACYPVPSQAATQAHWIEGGNPGSAPVDGDRHMLIVDFDNKILYELYHTHFTSGHWEAGSGAIWDMKTNNRRTEGITSADAAGLAILPGLVRFDEADPANPEPIRHAFRFTVSATNGHVFPASHDAGSTSGALPMGARLRLKASKDITGYAPISQKIFQAMKTYGLIVADNGSNMYIGGTFDTNWDNDILNPDFGDLTASDFEVIELGYQPPAPPLSIGDASATEGDSGTTTAVFTVTLSAPNTVPVNVNWATADGTAHAGSDYVAASGQLTFDPGTTTQTLAITVNGDTAFEGDEGFVVNLSSPVSASLGDAQGAGTILDDDPPPTLSVGDASVGEGDSGPVPIVFSVTLSSPSSLTTTVSYTTADGSATAPADYAATSGVLTFSPGTTTRSVIVAVNGDLQAEGSQTFDLTLSSPSNATIADGTGVGTILDDDAVPALVVRDTSVIEGQNGTRNAVFTVTLSAPSGAVTVDYVTADGTAQAGSDYVATSGTLSFAPTTTTGTIGVVVRGDRRPEGDEAFLVRLANAAGARIVRGVGQATIRDDDGARAACAPIAAVPFTITRSGAYCLAGDVSTSLASGAAILVQAGRVRIDLGGFTIRNTAGPATVAFGVYASGPAGVSLTHGALEGFFVGAFLGSPSTPGAGHVVRGLRARDSRWAGIWVEGAGARVLASTVRSSGGTPALGGDSDGFGIVARGSAARVSGNVVRDTAGTGAGSGYGIALADADGGQVARNIVANATLLASTGVAVTSSSGVTVNGNRLSTLDYGIVFDAGSTGTYFDNAMSAVATPYVGGTPGP